MANNPQLYNAILAGASGGMFQRWIVDTDPGNYVDARNEIYRFAETVDAAIPAGTEDTSRAQLIQSICQGVLSGRFLKQDATVDEVAQAIAALYQEIVTVVVPSGASGGPITVDDFKTSDNTWVQALNAALAYANTTEILITPRVYDIDGPVTCTANDKTIRFVPGAIFSYAANGLGTFVVSGQNTAVVGQPTLRWNTASVVSYVGFNLSGVGASCGDILLEVNANVDNCVLIRLAGNYSVLTGKCTIGGTGGSFKYAIEMSRNDGTSVLYARAGLIYWAMGDDGVNTRNFSALLRYRSVRSQAGPISLTSGGRHSFIAVVEVDGQHNSLFDPQINVSLSDYGILLRDDSEFFGIVGGEIVGGYKLNSVGIQWGDGSKVSGTPAIGQGKLFDTKIRNWEIGCKLTGSADAPMFIGCFIGNNRTAEMKIDSQRGASVWPISGMSFMGCYRESAAFPGTGVPFLLLTSGSMRGAFMGGNEIGIDGAMIVAEAGFSTNSMQFDGNRFPMTNPTDAVTIPNAASDYYFGLNDYQTSSLISKGAFADRAVQYKDPVLTTARVGALKIGATANPAITARLASFATANFGAGIPANGEVSLILPFAGVATTDYLTWNLVASLIDPALLYTCWISSAGNVTLRARNVTASPVGAITGACLFQAFRGF